MIVISGVLLLIAVVSLVIGLFSSLVWVYVSITVSVVSFVFLLLGVRQRKDVPALAGVGAGAGAVVEPAGPSRVRTALGADEADVTVVASRPAATASVAPPVAAPSGDVLVVPGRPRYHVSGCRYLSGREPEARTVAEARAEGFTACGVCRPDEVLSGAARPATQPTPVAVADMPADPPVTEPEAVRPAATRPAAKRPVAAAKAAAAKTPEARSDVAKTAATKDAAASSKSAAAKVTPARRPTAASASRSETVVVIPDRDKFHRGDCRYVRGVDGTQEIAKAKARREGYQPCGVCKP